MVKLVVNSSVRVLHIGKKSLAGRNVFGRITMRRRGGAQKQFYRVIDVLSTLVDLPCIVRTLEYDPNRNTFVALVCYITGILSYIIAYNNIFIGDVVIVKYKLPMVEWTRSGYRCELWYTGD